MSLEKHTSPALISVLLADDHDILRQGLRFLLTAQPDIHIAGEARTGKEAVEQSQRLQPDVVVMDISMPELDGLEACLRIRKQQPETQVLVLTMHESEEYFLQALRMGAIGYLVKKAAPAELCAAVRQTAMGEAFLYPGLAKALVRAYLTVQHDIPSGPPPSNALNVLTPREIEVLKLVAEGRTSREIADLLVLSVKTVQAHRAHIMEKLGLEHVTQLARFAVRHHLIPSEP